MAPSLGSLPGSAQRLDAFTAASVLPCAGQSLSFGTVQGLSLRGISLLTGHFRSTASRVGQLSHPVWGACGTAEPGNDSSAGGEPLDELGDGGLACRHDAA